MKTSKQASPPNGLYAVEEIIIVAASIIVESQFTVQKGRGDIQAYSVECGSDGATVNDLMKSNITISPNGVSSLDKSSLNKYTVESQREKSIIFPQCIPAASTVAYKIDNSNNANELVVSIIQYFYFPLQQMEIMENINNCE
jgi:hypothetical protein